MLQVIFRAPRESSKATAGAMLACTAGKATFESTPTLGRFTISA